MQEIWLVFAPGGTVKTTREAAEAEAHGHGYEIMHIGWESRFRVEFPGWFPHIRETLKA